jgi:hypothetical protein
METSESTTTFLIGFERCDYNENAIPNCKNRQDTKLKISDWISDFLFQVQDANNSIAPMPSQEALSPITTRFNPYARPSPRPRSCCFLKKYEIHQLKWVLAFIILTQFAHFLAGFLHLWSLTLTGISFSSLVHSGSETMCFFFYHKPPLRYF